jgi:hypothetical protein
MAPLRCTICRKLATDGTTCGDAVCLARAAVYKERAEAFARWKPRAPSPPALERAERKARDESDPLIEAAAEEELAPPTLEVATTPESAPAPHDELEPPKRQRKATRSKKRQRPKSKAPRIWWWVRDD